MTMTYPIDGITVLAQHEIIKTTGSIWPILAVILGILSISLLLTALVYDSNEMAIGSLICLILVAVSIFIGRGRFKQIETGRYEYQVLIDETVDINEVALHYDIIGQDGLIWTLEDKK